MLRIKVTKLKCAKCGKVWTPRNEIVRMCPYCKTTYFYKEKRRSIFDRFKKE